METLKQVQYLSAFLTPTIAIAGLIFAFLQYCSNEKKRKNELFDRRFEFYKTVEKWWLSTGEPDQPPPDIEDLIPIAQESKYLFSDDIAKHLLSLEDKTHTGSPFFPNSDFSKPFEKYLRLR